MPDVFSALADPTRRLILDRLRESEGGLTPQQLAVGVAMSQPAFSKHLRVLRECELIAFRSSGRERIYRINSAALQPVAAWLRQYDAFWATKLSALGDHLATQQAAAEPSEEDDQ